MEVPPPPPNVLHLGGVTRADYVPIEDKFSHDLLEQVAVPTLAPPGSFPTSLHGGRPGPPKAAARAEPSGRGRRREDVPMTYDKIPSIFRGVASWPTQTNLRCWNCSFRFSRTPRFLPTYVRQGEDGVIEMGVEGVMCTSNCVSRHIHTHYRGDKAWQAHKNLCLLHYTFTGKRLKYIKPSLRRFDLRQYGGDKTEEEFWEHMRGLDPDDGLPDYRPGSVRPERSRAPPLPRLTIVHETDADVPRLRLRQVAPAFQHESFYGRRSRHDIAADTAAEMATEMATEMAVVGPDALPPSPLEPFLPRARNSPPPQAAASAPGDSDGKRGRPAAGVREEGGGAPAEPGAGGPNGPVLAGANMGGSDGGGRPPAGPVTDPGGPGAGNLSGLAGDIEAYLAALGEM